VHSIEKKKEKEEGRREGKMKERNKGARGRGRE
jgi:hypothetical protein